jgi:hypothetical protein
MKQKKDQNLLYFDWEAMTLDDIRECLNTIYDKEETEFIIEDQLEWKAKMHIHLAWAIANNLFVDDRECGYFTVRLGDEMDEMEYETREGGANTLTYIWENSIENMVVLLKGKFIKYIDSNN